MARQRRSITTGHGAERPPLDRIEDVRRVRAVLALSGVPWMDLEDAVQEVRLKLLRTQSAPEANPIRNVGAWMSIAASRVAMDWHRGRGRDQGLRDRLERRWSTSPGHHPQSDVDLALTVAEGLEQLTKVQRQVLVLRFYEDLPVRDIAAHLEIPEGTVKSRLNAALAALRQRISEMEADQ